MYLLSTIHCSVFY